MKKERKKNLAHTNTLEGAIKKGQNFKTKFMYLGSNCSSDREKVLKFKLKAENLQKIWDQENNLFKQWEISTILEI